MAIKFLRHGFLRVAGGLALAGMLGASNGAALAQEICPERGGTIKAVDMNYTNMDPTARIDPASYLRLIYDSLIDVTMDLQNREVKKNSELVQFSFKAFELLKYLALRRGRTVSRDELLQEICGVDVEADVTTRTVDTHIANIRGKLTGGDVDRPFIVTVHKVGYKFVG